MAESVGDVLDAARQRKPVEYLAVRVGEEQHLAAVGVGRDVEAHIRLVGREAAVRAHRVLVAPDDLVSVRGNDARALDRRPLARLCRRVVVEEPPRKVDGIVSVVGEFDPVETLVAVARLEGHAVLGHHLVDGHRGLHVGRNGTSLRRQRHVLRGDERHRSGVDRIARGWRERNRDDGPLLERVGSVRVWRHLKPGDRHLADRYVVNRWHRQHHGLGLFRLHRSREGRDIAGSNI